MVLTTIHAIARALEGRAELAYGGRARRTALTGLVYARPWQVPGDAAAHSNRCVARGPGWDATLPEVTSWRPQMPGCKTTIAWAQRDRLLLAGRQAPRAARWLPEARHVTLRGCGHVPMWDDPDQVARAIADARP